MCSSWTEISRATFAGLVERKGKKALLFGRSCRETGDGPAGKLCLHGVVVRVVDNFLSESVTLREKLTTILLY